MLEVLKKTANKTYTENGAVTHRTSGKDCLDLFAAIGALRRADDQNICSRFLKAYAENPDLAMKILFYARDVRGGLGERRVFRSILAWLASDEKSSVVRNLPYIAEYGRWDDVLVLLKTPCRKEALALLEEQFREDLAALEAGGDISLLGKWLPSVNASNQETVIMAKMIAKSFGLSDRDYRKALTGLRARIRIIENNLREKDYTFDYSKQPSKAMFKYRKAFLRNDGERYAAFMDKVDRGEAKLHTGTLMPYELVALMTALRKSAALWTSPGVRWRTSRPMRTRLSQRTAPAPCTGAANRCRLRSRNPSRFISRNTIKANSTIIS